MTIFFIGIAAFFSTFLGGMFALRFKDKLHLILGFSAGAVIGVAFFDLLPEAIDLGKQYFDVSVITSVAALGFILYMLLDRIISLSVEREAGNDAGESLNHTHSGNLGAGSLVIHSFLDGLAVGFAFQVSPAVGIIVTVAVLVHDFSDGINTVNLSMLGEHHESLTRRWLYADAIAPILGIAATLFVTLPERWLAIVLALFCGFFLYIGASELLPESHHRHPRIWTSVMTLAGIIVLYLAIHLATL